MSGMMNFVRRHKWKVGMLSTGAAGVLGTLLRGNPLADPPHSDTYTHGTIPIISVLGGRVVGVVVVLHEFTTRAHRSPLVVPSP